MKIRCLIVVLLLLSSLLRAEDVKIFSVSDMFGVSRHEFISLCKDNNGFVWASSISEVIRLTTNDYRSYRLPYASKDVVFVELAGNGRELAAYTNNKQIFRYNEVADCFDLLQLPLSINELLISQDGVYWIASPSGLYRYHGDELNLTGEAARVPMIAWGENGKIIFAQNDAINMLDINTLEIKRLCDFPLGSSAVSEIYCDAPAQQILLGTLIGKVFSYNIATASLTELTIKDRPLQPVLAIESNSDTTCLVGFDGKGIYMLDKRTGQTLAIFEENADRPFSLIGNGVYDILYDDESKIVWVCSITGGVSFFSQTSSPVTLIQHRINEINSLHNNHVNQILEDSQGNLWFATDNGLSRYDLKRRVWNTSHSDEKQQSMVFLSLCEDDEGRIWAGTYSSGVYLFDVKTGRETAHYTSANISPANDFVFDIYKDCNGDVWIGGNQNNVIVYSKSERTFRSYALMAVSAFYELNDSTMLMACANGLMSIDKSSGVTETLVPNQSLNDLLVYRDEVWLCTNGDGLLHYNLKNKTLEKITEQAGLNSNYTNSILLADGFLWTGTEQGLCRVNPDDGSVVNYSALLALDNTKFNRAANCRFKDGHLAFGTGDGAVIFNPAEVKFTPSQGRIFVQDILVNGHSIRDDKALQNATPVNQLTTLHLKYNQNNIAIEMFPISSKNDKFRFSWTMEGQDEEWSPVSTLRKLNYTNIPAGDYTLALRMYDNSMTQVAERHIAVVIEPPFWNTWWFGSLVTIALFYIAFIALRFYINRLKQRNIVEKIRFFANVAHDIRTSLMLISAPVDRMNAKETFSEPDRYYLNTVKLHVHRLLTMATHLLDFQKADIGRGQPVFSMTDLAALIAKCLKTFEAAAADKEIVMELVTSPSTYVSAIDAAMMERVFDNLISNAVKYSPQKGKITVAFAGGEKKWTLSVKDCGIGVSKKERRKLFKEFYRGENAVNSKIIGSGLGLLLVKNYVSLHGGKITCNSRENEGAEFIITAPYKKVEAQAQGAAAEAAAEDMAAATASDNIAPTAQQPAAAALPKMAVLIVEDNISLLNFMTHALSEEFEVSAAQDGVQAWEMIMKKAPDLIVSDVMMPNCDGFELCRLLKSTFETSHIPLIMLTSLTDKAQQLHALGLGADDYLTKPFDVNILAERIKTIVKNRRLVREKALKMLEPKPDDRLFENELNDRFMKKAVEVVRSNIDNEAFGIDAFAAAMNVSNSLLYKKIRAFTDQSPIDFVRSIRLNHARELLQTRRYTVTEVADLCGFSSLKYFSASFKSFFGMPPSEA
jgi:signal transduction histidine kinase/CheY-like chemotaxis protein/ligand-binding sensor domain-containing protein/AraC-like DNA-binding protein